MFEYRLAFDEMVQRSTQKEHLAIKYHGDNLIMGNKHVISSSGGAGGSASAGIPFNQLPIVNGKLNLSAHGYFQNVAFNQNSTMNVVAVKSKSVEDIMYYRT